METGVSALRRRGNVPSAVISRRVYARDRASRAGRRGVSLRGIEVGAHVSVVYEQQSESRIAVELLRLY
jgi:hypothetical protein